MPRAKATGRRETIIVRKANEALDTARKALNYAADVALVEGDTYGFAVAHAALRVLGEDTDNRLTIRKVR